MEAEIEAVNKACAAAVAPYRLAWLTAIRYPDEPGFDRAFRAYDAKEDAETKKAAEAIARIKAKWAKKVEAAKVEWEDLAQKAHEAQKNADVLLARSREAEKRYMDLREAAAKLSDK